MDLPLLKEKIISHVHELPAINHIRKKKKPAGQQGDLDPAGASNSAGVWGGGGEKGSSDWGLVAGDRAH